MATSKQYTVKLGEADYKLLKRLATARKQAMTVVFGEALAEFNARHGKQAPASRGHH